MFSKPTFRLLLHGVAVFVLWFSGCGTPVPENQPVTIVVKSAKGEPMNMVKVKFIPLTEGLDGNYIATGVTDDNGSCMPTVPGNPEVAGVPACKHKVLFSEAPVSPEARAGEERGDQSIARKELKSRRHRPIPNKYSRLLTTPIDATVAEDQLEIEFVLE
jgi:hypothetical protein